MVPTKVSQLNLGCVKVEEVIEDLIEMYSNEDICLYSTCIYLIVLNFAQMRISKGLFFLLLYRNFEVGRF